MEGFANRQSKRKIQATIAGFKGEAKNPRFQIWNRDYDPNKDQLGPDQEIRSGYCYDTFETFTGYIDSMELVDVDIPYQGVQRKFKRLFVNMRAGNDIILFDIGTYTGRYAQAFLERMLNPKLNINKLVKIFPYHIPQDDGNSTIGVAMYQVDGDKEEKIEFLRREAKEELGIPEPEVIETDNGKQWIWGKRMTWIFNYVKNRLITENADFGMETQPPPIITGDDLPESEPIVPDPIEEHPGMKMYPKPAYVPPRERPINEEDDLPFN